jgi:hypothetical protein
MGEGRGGVCDDDGEKEIRVSNESLWGAVKYVV